MNPNTFPTKGNLINAQNTLKLSRQGYDLLDKKRNVLIREIMELNEKATNIQESIEEIFSQAYRALQAANIGLGVGSVERFSAGVPVETSIAIKARSIMGVEIPLVSYDKESGGPFFGFGNTSSALDEAVVNFAKAKDLIIQLSIIENTAYRLAINIRKTQKRANALKNVTIPRYEKLVKDIQETLEERERDDFTRLKVVKKVKSSF